MEARRISGVFIFATRSEEVSFHRRILPLFRSTAKTLYAHVSIGFITITDTEDGVASAEKGAHVSITRKLHSNLGDRNDTSDFAITPTEFRISRGKGRGKNALMGWIYFSYLVAMKRRIRVRSKGGINKLIVFLYSHLVISQEKDAWNGTEEVTPLGLSSFCLFPIMIKGGCVCETRMNNR